jgi:hypothetical protein
VVFHPVDWTPLRLSLQAFTVLALLVMHKVNCMRAGGVRVKLVQVHLLATPSCYSKDGGASVCIVGAVNGVYAATQNRGEELQRDWRGPMYLSLLQHIVHNESSSIT